MPKTRTRGDDVYVTECSTAPLAEVVLELQSLQRQRSIILKSAVMQSNRLQAIVAQTLGYRVGLPDGERRKKFTEASAVIKAVSRGESDHPDRNIIAVTLEGVHAFEDEKKRLGREMERWARRLRVYPWACRPEQRGLGELFLAIVVGETGDLASYPNPGKVWRRLGCAPWTFAGQTLMGATWRSGRQGKLPAEEWELFGYSPRRRSIAYLIGESIVKLNFVAGDVSLETDGGRAGDDPFVTEEGGACEGTLVTESGNAGDEAPVTDAPRAGPYRQRYLDSKAKLQAAHPEYPPLRCHLHGMLLATKLLLKNLWVEWNRSTTLPV